MAIENKELGLINNKKFVETAKQIYDEPLEQVTERINNLLTLHQTWNTGEIMLFSSPGRIEVIGNHTDHNNGQVVAAAVTVDTLASVTPTTDGYITINSIGFPLVKVDTTKNNFIKSEEGTSEALVRGILHGFINRGYQIGGFNATTVSSVFKGAGMSSSASFELLVCEILNNLYNQGSIPAIEKAIISQYAENVFFGKPSGLMDQAAIALGGVSYIDFKNPNSPQVDTLKWSFNDVSVVVVNCGGDHCDLTPNYSAIKSDMELVAKYFGQTKLRFVNEDDFYNKLGLIKNNISGRAILRAMHYFEENKRVQELRQAINNNQEEKSLNIINQSGESSYKKLQNLYPEGQNAQPIPLALAIAKRQKGVVAARVHGGGFAGTILTFVKNENRDEFSDYMSNIYGKDNVYVVSIRDKGTVRIF